MMMYFYSDIVYITPAEENNSSFSWVAWKPKEAEIRRNTLVLMVQSYWALNHSYPTWKSIIITSLSWTMCIVLVGLFGCQVHTP